MITIGEYIAHYQPDMYKQIYMLCVIDPLKHQAKGQLRMQEVDLFYKRMMEQIPGFGERLSRLSR